MTDVMMVGARGGFCAANNLPSASSLQSSHAGDAGSESRWVVRTRGVDPRGFRVICNAILAFSQVVHPIRRISIHPAGFTSEAGRSIFQPVTASSQKSVYPAVSTHLGFEVRMVPPGSYRHERRSVVDFASVPAESVIDTVVQLADLWSGVAFGGYPVEQDDVITGNCAIFNVLAQPFDDRAVEIVVGNFGGSEAAWASLINLMAWVHATLSPVRSMTIN
jgi:hypothetical protein